ncbi:hypothetical protein Nepgr_033740 [Nepenthes gracilis]|uniref:Uncharacterized protein n=1 Tax=Nepenthes gracilis TaxID=150966 RepID=A0AAD3TMH7_NEPGR|nr:hypothetical protein Nepgr_033740 [Nepenthes gracilis]
MPIPDVPTSRLYVIFCHIFGLCNGFMTSYALCLYLEAHLDCSSPYVAGGLFLEVLGCGTYALSGDSAFGLVTIQLDDADIVVLSLCYVEMLRRMLAVISGTVVCALVLLLYGLRSSFRIECSYVSTMRSLSHYVVLIE